MPDKWYIAYIRDIILRYIFNLCLSSSGEIITIKYRYMYQNIEPELKRLNISERQFRYVWQLIRKQFEPYIVHKDTHRGIMILRRELCYSIVPLRIIAMLTDKKLETRREVEKEYWRQWLIKQLLGGAGDGVSIHSSESYESSI